jgi:hypothetical protein
VAEVVRCQQSDQRVALRGCAQSGYEFNQFNGNYIDIIEGFGQILAHSDKEGRPLIWFDMKKMNAMADTEKVNQYVVYLVETLDRNSTHQGWAVICDLTGFGKDLNLKMMGSIAQVFIQHYPRGPKYIASMELPSRTRKMTKVLFKTMLNEEMKDLITFIDKDQLNMYLDTKFIPKE